jgi:hypothetical protein
VGLSDSANQGLFLRNFLTLQGYDMAAVTVYQDNLSCIGAREVWGRAYAARLYTLLLDEGPGGQGRGRHSAQGDCRAICECADQAPTGSQFVYGHP